MRTKKQNIFLFLKILGIAIGFAVITLILFRDAVLQQVIAKVSYKMEQDYDSDFSVKKAQFDGFATIHMEDVVLVPKKADTLFRIESIKTHINLWQLMAGNIQLESLEAKNGFAQLVKTANGRNFDAFLPKKKKTTTIKDTKTNYAELAYDLLNTALNLVPTEMQLENLTLRMDDMGKRATMRLNKLSLADKQMETSIRVQTNTFTQRWRIKGFVDSRNKKTDIRFFNIDTGKIKVPYFDERYNLKASFDSIRLNVSNIDKDGDELQIDGFTSISNFTVNHPKIAQKDVVIKNARFDYHLLFGEHFMAIDSSSVATLNKIKFRPFVEYNNEKDKIYKLKIAIPKMRAQDFITSLPEGLFTHFEGMEAEGNFDYQLDFLFNDNKPDAVVFDSKLHKEGLKIVKYGDANLNKLNGEFIYHAIINDVPQRPVLVGNANPNYTPLDQISPYLQKSVLTTEDPSFFSHKGFINEAFKQSIVKNIRTRKFSRGASTISMQLVKNVFLTREKTLSRKLEEILLVYILENNRIASKERMLEVYFNIIEWGPNVYGIGEASNFYFQKTPTELSINECLFLANIIPSPRKFMYQFNDEGNLKPYAIKRDIFIRNLMLRRGIITSEDTIYQLPIMISGTARSHLRIKELNLQQLDTMSVEEFNF
ncbi:transglycosylase domain-containing protein [Flavobacterium sp. GT3R68]|uniref:transglycosylase domain-containing protein n=1 Tax=Flavobacterium sp. GT3R68 TaxID=2594437 RepID=UPI000F85D76D|nr:biosynthetic peptidoglycan transglycosylase [Flavobacterium sp. GT3R68]RTY90848.1 glycosyl transferase [Flavobacterium sp. GSN2]TRW93841.1 glycosyl transferase [Flavobacterium sp. GT3R68]